MANVERASANQNGASPNSTRSSTKPNSTGQAKVLAKSSKPQLNKRKFKQNFTALTPLILQEWLQLEPDELLATKGEVEQVVDYVAEQTERTRTLIRRQLAELYLLVIEEQSAQAQVAPEQRSASPTQSPVLEAAPEESLEDTHGLRDQVLPTIERTLKLLEKRAEKLFEQTEDELLSQVSTKVKTIEQRAEEMLANVEKNILPEVKTEKDKKKLNTSLLTVFGVGLILGLIFGGFRGRR